MEGVILSSRKVQRVKALGNVIFHDEGSRQKKRIRKEKLWDL
jgi:hypothetical protein